MKKIKNIINKNNYKYLIFAFVITLSFIIIGFVDKNFWENLTESIKTTLESTKPTEGLFDDTSEVKLVTVLFGDSSCLVSTSPIDYDLKIDNYKNCVNDDGLITVIEASGILYAPYDGEICIKKLVDNVTEITINHSKNFKTVFSGVFGLGISDGENIIKGQPIALMLGDMQFYILNNDEIINEFNSSGEILWKN